VEKLALEPVVQERKLRGAFFTPPEIADYLAAWAVNGDSAAKVLDPSCGEAVFLQAAARQLVSSGCSPDHLDEQLFGVDIHPESLVESARLLEDEGLDARLIASDFFAIDPPTSLFSPLPHFDAVIGNPPFVRYQAHAGAARTASTSAAAAQGVALSGLSSSWAPLLVHACAFLKPEGRVAMVVPAELLSVNYASPIREWLRQRFESVHLVLIEELQFHDALEKVMLLVATGSGPSDGALSAYHVRNSTELRHLRPFDHFDVVPRTNKKWTELLLPPRARRAYETVLDSYFGPLSAYATVELGTVTGANGFFTMTESRRIEAGLSERQVIPIVPPGSRHLDGLHFTDEDWERLRDDGERVWLLFPDDDDKSPALRAYLETGVTDAVPLAYKCRVRKHWWKPPAVTPPTAFLTYMSHLFPRIVRNDAGVTFLNSMHGVRTHADVEPAWTEAIPVLAMNSVTILGAELNGRSYGGGILKVEPREAASLPIPNRDLFDDDSLEKVIQLAAVVEAHVQAGDWDRARHLVDALILQEVLGLDEETLNNLELGVQSLRSRRLAA
jgi:adenine-specific DNA methylase